MTFKDIILLVQNAYFCVAKAKIRTPDGNFYLILNGTDRLELTFGIVRSMVGNDANADVLTLGYRLSHAVECLNILAEHPTWDRGPRHLRLHGIEDGNGNVRSKCDHITPDSWEGNIVLRTVTLLTVWNLGHQMVSTEFVAVDIEGVLQELEHSGYDMEFPFGHASESADKSDNDNDIEGDSAPIAPDMQPLSAQDVMTLISSLRPGEGECHILTIGHVLRMGKGDDPILDLEDHASIETSRDGRGDFSPLVDIRNGKEVPKACVLCELERATFSKVPGSTDRLDRCAGLSRYTKTATLPDLTYSLIDSTSEALLLIGDPAATVVQCNGQFFLAVIQINKILVDTSPVLKISASFLMEPTVAVHFQIYQVIETSQDDPNINSTNWKWNQKLECTVLKTTGPFIQVINPAIAIPEINTPVYYL